MNSVGVTGRGWALCAYALAAVIAMTLLVSHATPAGAVADTIQSCVKAGQVRPSFLSVRASTFRWNYHDDVSNIEGAINVKLPDMPSGCDTLVRRLVDVKIWYSTTGDHQDGTPGFHMRAVPTCDYRACRKPPLWW